MKLWAVFVKSMREQLRDWKLLIMAVAIPPFFLCLYWLMSEGGTPAYPVLVMNRDSGGVVDHSQKLLDSMRKMAHANGRPMLRLVEVEDRSAGERDLKDRKAAAMLVFADDFSQVVERAADGAPSESAPFTIVGDISNSQYPIASILLLTEADEYLRQATGTKPTVPWKEELVGQKVADSSDFDAYVPGLLILSIIMVLFTTAIAVVREMEQKTLLRLRISSLRAFDFLAGITLSQTLIGLMTLAVSFATALALGFHSEGPLPAALVVAVLTALSVTAVGLITACFCKTSGSVLTIGTFPFFLLMWFTGAAYPLPPLELFAVGSHHVAANDLLAPTHAVIAMNKIFTHGASLTAVSSELAAIFLLTSIYFAVGVALYNRLAMKAG